MRLCPDARLLTCNHIEALQGGTSEATQSVNGPSALFFKGTAADRAAVWDSRATRRPPTPLGLRDPTPDRRALEQPSPRSRPRVHLAAAVSWLPASGRASSVAALSTHGSPYAHTAHWAAPDDRLRSDRRCLPPGGGHCPRPGRGRLSNRSEPCPCKARGT